MEINNKINYKDEIIEIELGPNDEMNEETTKFLIEKVQEAMDEGIYYTQEEAMKLLDKMIEENNKCIAQSILKEQ